MSVLAEKNIKCMLFLIFSEGLKLIFMYSPLREDLFTKKCKIGVLTSDFADAGVLVGSGFESVFDMINQPHPKSRSEYPDLKSLKIEFSLNIQSPKLWTSIKISMKLNFILKEKKSFFHKVGVGSGLFYNILIRI